MTPGELAEQLRRDLAYDSPSRALPWLTRLPGGTWTVFHYYMMKGFIQCGLRVNPAVHDPELMLGASIDELRAAEIVGARVSVRGLAHLAGLSGPAVIVANHMSTLETTILPTFILPFGKLSFVLKPSLLKIPIMGRAIRGFLPIVVSRNDARADLRMVLEEGPRRLKAGTSVLIFPQSTRTPDFDPARFSSLGVKLARRAGVPLVPCALRTDFWTPGHWVREVGRIHPERPVHFEFGPPIPADAGTDREAQAQVVAFISERVRSWGGSVAEPPKT